MSSSFKYSTIECFFFLYLLIEEKSNTITHTHFQIFSTIKTIAFIKNLVKYEYISSTIFSIEKESFLFDSRLNDDKLIELSNHLEKQTQFIFSYNINRSEMLKILKIGIIEWGDGTNMHNVKDYPYKKISLQKKEIADIFIKSASDEVGNSIYYSYKPGTDEQLDVLTLVLYFSFTNYIEIKKIIFRDGITFQLILLSKFNEVYNTPIIGSGRITFDKVNSSIKLDGVGKDGKSIVLDKKYKNHAFILALLAYNGETLSYSQIEKKFKENDSLTNLKTKSRSLISEGIDDIYYPIKNSKKIGFLFSSITKVKGEGYRILI